MNQVQDRLKTAWWYQNHGEAKDAAPIFREILETDPSCAEAHYGLGNSFMTLRQFPDALASYDRALECRPEYPEAHNNAGVALAEQARYTEAVARYHEALRLAPDYAEAHFNLGNALRNLEQYEEAAASYRDAVRLRQDWPEAANALGNTLAYLVRYDEAISIYTASLQQHPEHAETHNNLGLALQAVGRLGEALAHFDQAIRHSAEFAAPHANRAQVWLLLGHYRAGWPEFEWRWRLPGKAPPQLPRPAWDGGPLGGRTILLWVEQGLGDTIQFLRYASLVQQMNGRALLACQKDLVSLLSTCPWIEGLAPHGSPLPPFEVHAPLLSLPGLLGTTAVTIPAPVPYLRAEHERVARWRTEVERLAGSAKLKIGIAWRGSKGYPQDYQRSIPLHHFAALAGIPGVQLFSLQKGQGEEEVAQGTVPVIDLTERLDQDGAFLDTAALMMSLDLIISADTSISHLGGALGVPVWLALALVPDWRWLLGREDSPWYPHHRLFRQTVAGRWEDVFERLASAVRERLEKPTRSVPITIEVGAGELIDKITILEIKCDRIQEIDRLAHVQEELATLTQARDRVLRPSGELAALTDELKAVNVAIWEVEDELRARERAGDFGERFVELARSVYRNNDRRAAIKRKINELAGSRLIEEKSYPSYS
jgi:tetratricopeptide (TPR) repeat protein